MDLAATILGHTTVQKLQEIGTASIITIGSDRLTRGELAAVGCYNFVAAKNLSAILNQHFQVKHLKEVFETIPPAQLVLPRLGSISLAVLGAAFEAKRIGGASPLEAYVQKHLPKDAKIVTFETTKRREHQDAARERKARRRRQQQRKDRAHQIRVERFTERTADQTGT